MQNVATAELVTIGDELLIGQVIDTNSAWLGEQLGLIGVAVTRRTAIGDSHNAIIATLQEAMARSPLVIVTGGLGPTKDDITKKALCDMFACGMREDAKVLEHIAGLFARFGRELTDLNRLQAQVPEASTAMHNANGTAPGMWFEHPGGILISLPGVPYEMKGIMTDVGLPRIRAHFSTPFILHRTVLTMGMGESWLSERIAAWEDALPVGFKLAYLPSPGRVRLRLSATGSEANVRAEMIRQLARLEVIIPELIYGHDDETIESVVGRLLLERNATLSTAESCTGGLVAHMVTSVPGSSVYFLGSIVAYSYEMKMQHLGVHPDTLSLYGAVSEQAVREMATGVCLATGSTYGIAISGIAGPAGGLPDKPVGTVWITVHGPDGTRAKRYQFGDDRGRNIERSALTALNMLRKVLVGQ